MKIIPVKTPLLLKKMFSNYIWNIDTKRKELFLTFDDGPTPKITNWTLDILKTYNAKATFFCIGSNVEKHPDIFNHIISEGHSIGNHTQNHRKGWTSNKTDYLNEVLACERSIKSQLVSNSESKDQLSTRLFRPPHGQIKSSQGKQLMALGYKIIMWNILSFDWDKNLNKEVCANNVISKSKPGSIIVFHDSVKASKNMVYALPKVLEHFSNLGYTFKALD